MLLPNSLDLLLLEELTLAANSSQPFMQAIVVLKLIHFGYSDNHRDLSQELANFGTASKFSHVQRSTLSFASDVKAGNALCQEFWGVRDVSLRANTIRALS